MAEEMKHTPTPWDPDVVKIIFEGGLQALIDSGKAGVGETLYACVSGQAELDAFHAAHCVNVHDKLVSALETAAPLICSQFCNPEEGIHFEECEAITAALSNGKGERDGK